MSRKDDDFRTVGELARLLGVSVRTLHHWEHKGLLTPTERTFSDYRLYSAEDCQRAQNILVYKATGMPLEKIGELLDNRSQQVEYLHHQRQLLIEKQAELQTMIEALDLIMEDTLTEQKLSQEDIAGIINNAHFAAYQAEAEEKWGETDDWAISQKTVSQFKAQDWQDLKDATEQLENRMAYAVQEGISPESSAAQNLAEEHRKLLSTYFPVTYSKHVLIARGYVADPRFTEHYDKRTEGLAQWLKAAIDANAQTHGTDPESADWE